MIRSFEDALGDTSLQADVVIVGTGPGGAAIARVLAESGRKVVLVEEGPPASRFRRNFTNAQRYHFQEGGAMVAGGSGLMPIAAGRGVGGGSLVNSAIALRTPAAVLDGWAALLGGDDRFSRSKLDPVYDEIEALIGVGVSSEAVSGENNLIIARGAAKLGLPGGLIRRNAPGCVGCSHCNNGCPSGGKASVDRNLLAMAREHGAVVQADVKVDTVLVEGDRAGGVAGVVHHTETLAPVGRLVVRAPTVIIAAGGVGTPRLLHHAGLASRLGARVGAGLHVHPGNAVLGLCDHEVAMWRGATQGAWFEDPELPGVLPHTFNAPPAVVSALLLQNGFVGKAAFEVMPHLCGAVVMISDKGEGSVGATSEGRASLKYWFDDHDIDRIKAGMVSTARVLLAGGARRVFGAVHGVGIHDSAASFERALARSVIADFALYAAHPMASCRMGADPSRSVVGVDGQAHGLRSLYVADSSVFPTSLGVNPQLTTMVVATVLGRSMVASA
jgi:choline dehydrogenase-like flavoprotein